MNVHRWRPRPAAVPAAGGRAAKFHLFDDTYGQGLRRDARGSPALRRPPAQATPREGAAGARARSRSCSRGAVERRQPLPYPPPSLLPAGARQRPLPLQRPPRQGGKARPRAVGSAGLSPTAPQPTPSDAVAFRFFSDQKRLNDEQRRPGHDGNAGALSPHGHRVKGTGVGAPREAEDGEPARPSVGRSPGSPPCSGYKANRDDRRGRRTAARADGSQPEKRVKHRSRPSSCQPPPSSARAVDAWGGGDCQVQPYPYTSDSDSNADVSLPIAEAGAGRFGDAAPRRGAAGDEGDGDTAAAAAADRFTGLSGQQERELCGCMVSFLSALPQDEANRVLEEVRQGSEARRVSCRYGGVYGARVEGTAGGVDDDGRRAMLSFLQAKWVAVRDRQQSEAAAEREARRRAWVKVKGSVGAPAGAEGNGRRHRKLVAARTAATASPASPAPVPWHRKGPGEDPPAAAGSSPSVPRPPARKGRYPSFSAEAAEGSPEDAELRGQRVGHQDGRLGSDSDECFEAPRNAFEGLPRRIDFTRLPPPEDSSSLVDDGDAEAMGVVGDDSPVCADAVPLSKAGGGGSPFLQRVHRMVVPLSLRMDDGVSFEPVVVTADDGTEITLSPGAAAARAVFLAENPGEPYRVPANVAELWSGNKRPQQEEEEREEEEREEEETEDGSTAAFTSPNPVERSSPQLQTVELSSHYDSVGDSVLKSCNMKPVAPARERGDPPGEIMAERQDVRGGVDGVDGVEADTTTTTAMSTAATDSPPRQPYLATQRPPVHDDDQMGSRSSDLDADLRSSEERHDVSGEGDHDEPFAVVNLSTAEHDAEADGSDPPSPPSPPSPPPQQQQQQRVASLMLTSVGASTDAAEGGMKAEAEADGDDYANGDDDFEEESVEEVIEEDEGNDIANSDPSAEEDFKLPWEV